MGRIVVRPRTTESTPTGRSGEGADPDVFQVSWRVAPTRAGAEAPRVGFSIRPPAPVAKVEPIEKSSRWTLAVWLVSYSVVWWALLVAMPDFKKTFQETGITPPAPTEWAIAAADLARSVPGVLVGVAGFVGSILFFARANGRRRALESILAVGIVLAFGVIAFLIWSAFTPMIQLTQKL